MLVRGAETRALEIELRQQAHYWRALHARATERAAAWKEKAQRLEQVLYRQQAQIAELTHSLRKRWRGWPGSRGRSSAESPSSAPSPSPANRIRLQPLMATPMLRMLGIRGGCRPQGTALHLLRERRAPPCLDLFRRACRRPAALGLSPDSRDFRRGTRRTSIYT